MSVRQFSVVPERDSDDEVWVTHVPALDHLPTYGHTREDTLEATIGYLETAAKSLLVNDVGCVCLRWRG